MHIVNRVLFYIEIISIAVALVFGVLWIRNPNGPYEPITFIALLLGSSVVELIRRYLPTKIINSVPYDILNKIEPSSSKEKVQEILGAPHRIISNMWLYRFRKALIQVEFYENGAVKTVALALTIHSPKRGFVVPMHSKPLGQIAFSDFGLELSRLRHRSSLRTSELLLETRAGPPGAWVNFTFGSLSPLARGMLADANIPHVVDGVDFSKAAKLRINWVGISESSEEVYFEWSLAIPAIT
jgi:hypothetical protein